MVTLSIIFILLLLSGFFSSSETALTICSKAKMHQRMQTDYKAKRVYQLMHTRENTLTGILLGNNIVNILATSLLTSWLITHMGEEAVAYVTIIMTIVIVLFAEVLPKTYAVRHPEGLALTVAPLLYYWLLVMRPFLSIISKINIFFLKLFADKTATNHDNEELRGFIDLYAIAKTSSEDKNKVREERAMLRSILDLDDTDVEKIMVHRKEVYMINYDQEPVEIIEQLASSRYTRIPVWKDSTSNITGVIHIREALKLLTAKNEDINHDDINSIITEPWFIPETVSLVDQMRAFQKRQEHFSVVVDEYGSFMGIVTLEDIIEEIIGDIKDEHDMPIKGVYKNSDGSYNVKGNITIRDLNRELNLGLDEDDATTIAGFVINIARKIPDNHQVFSHQNFSFEVIRRHKNQLTLIKIKELNQL